MELSAQKFIICIWRCRNCWFDEGLLTSELWNIGEVEGRREIRKDDTKRWMGVWTRNVWRRICFPVGDWDPRIKIKKKLGKKEHFWWEGWAQLGSLAQLDFCNFSCMTKPFAQAVHMPKYSSWPSLLRAPAYPASLRETPRVESLMGWNVPLSPSHLRLQHFPFVCDGFLLFHSFFLHSTVMSMKEGIKSVWLIPCAEHTACSVVGTSWIHAERMNRWKHW